MVRWSLVRTRLGWKSMFGGALPLAWVLAVGCAGAPAPIRSAEESPEIYSFTPSPLLTLARSERELAGAATTRARAGLRSETTASGHEEGGDAADTDADTDTSADEPEMSRTIHRTIHVRPSRLATQEDLLRAALRHAPSRRAQELHASRFLVRATHVRAPSAKMRRRARTIVDKHDRQTELCLAQEAADRTEVVLRSPTALVIEEALLTGTLTYRLTVRLHGDAEPDVEASPAVNENTQRCLKKALTPAADEHPGHARVTLSAFAQRASSPSSGHRYLANEAAFLGWIELERGKYLEALAFFEDAYWLYHRPEYELLQAMALHKLGRLQPARTHYQAFVDARPDAPETPILKARIAALPED